VPITSQGAPGLPWAGAVALDTQTGQLCKTYSIQTSNATADWVLNLPHCTDLYSSTEKTLALERQARSGEIDKEIMEAVEKVKREQKAKKEKD